MFDIGDVIKMLGNQVLAVVAIVIAYVKLEHNFNAKLEVLENKYNTKLIKLQDDVDGIRKEFHKSTKDEFDKIENKVEQNSIDISFLRAKARSDK